MSVRLVAAAVSVSALVAAPAAAQSDACPPADAPRVAVLGASSPVTAIRGRLAGSGIDLAESGRCATARAAVRELPGGLEVSLTDGEGRRARRRVSTPAVAATWIESWLRRDLGAPLLLAPALTPRAVAPARTASPLHDRGAAAAPAAAAPRWSISALSQSMSASDGARWRTVGGGACWTVGPLCVGGGARYGEARDLSANDGMTLARRRGVDALVGARLPLAIGAANLVPNLGVGLGWQRTARDEPSLELPGDPNNGCSDDPTDPDLCEPVPGYIGDGFSAWSVGLRIDAGVDLSLPINRHLAVDLGVGLGLAPTAHREPFDPFAGDSDGNLGPDGQLDPPPPSDPLFLLPGEPHYSTWWSIGLRVTP